MTGNIMALRTQILGKPHSSTYQLTQHCLQKPENLEILEFPDLKSHQFVLTRDGNGEWIVFLDRPDGVKYGYFDSQL
jgi:hypothetical protein